MGSRLNRARLASRAAFAVLASSTLAAPPILADSISGSSGILNNGTDPGVRANVYRSYHDPFSSGAVGPLSSIQASVSYGAASATADLSIADYSYTNQQYASAGGGGQWSTTVTINNPSLNGQQGVLHTAFHVAGSFSVDQIPLPWGQAEGNIYVDGNIVALVGYDSYNPPAYNPHVEDYANIPYDRAFTFGV